jgi:RNA polymerase sigma-70 factor (ECF subfamily)
MDRAETTTLLRRAREGSDEALNRLLERCAGRLLAYIRLRLGRSLRARVESCDILNDSLLKAFQRIDQFEQSDGRSLMAWLSRIAENQIRDQANYHHRRRRDAARAVPLGDDLEHLAAQVRSQTSRLVFREETRRLECALDDLDEAYREVILLRKFEELSFAEIGQRMRRTPDACRMLLARAMTALTLKMRETS